MDRKSLMPHLKNVRGDNRKMSTITIPPIAGLDTAFDNIITLLGEIPDILGSIIPIVIYGVILAAISAVAVMIGSLFRNVMRKYL